jgi:hypothetical protein
MNVFKSGVRPAVDQYLLDEAAKIRDYGDYFSASSAGYCMRKIIFDRLKVPYVKEDARKQRVFSVGHIFHEWIQGITKEAGISIAQEVELQDEDLMIRGHFDDLILVQDPRGSHSISNPPIPRDKLILYDYKTQNSRAFSYKRSEMSYYHKMQLATYLYMLQHDNLHLIRALASKGLGKLPIKEARILKISKDDLRMTEETLFWTPELEKEITDWWKTLNEYWKSRKLPPCTCADREGGFMAKDTYNPYYYDGEPCSVKWLELHKNKEKSNE